MKTDQPAKFTEPLAAFSLLLLLVLLTCTSGNSVLVEAQRRTSTHNATLVCVVSHRDTDSGEGIMDAVALVVNGKLKQPYPEYNEAAQNAFASHYFVAGKKYRVTFGGGEVGSATIKGSENGCNNIHAIAKLEDNGKLPPELSGLATSSETLGKQLSSRRAPTDQERQAAMKLVAQIYRSRGVTAALLRTLTTTNLTATDLNGDGKFELIGSFVVETKAKARRDLLMIAEPTGATFRAALASFQAYRMSAEGFDSAVDFVDQLDIDGDGVGEVFVTQHGFDAYGYAVYKKINGRWKQIYSAGGDAC